MSVTAHRALERGQEGRREMHLTERRVIVYEMRDGTESVFEIDNHEMERHERASADQNIHSRENLESSNPCVGYHFEIQVKKFWPSTGEWRFVKQQKSWEDVHPE
jgi:hypothetical protein